MKELQMINRMNLDAEMDLRRADIKQQNKNVNRHLFSIMSTNQMYMMETMSKTNVFEWYSL